MKFEVAAILTAVGIATAQLDGVPECGVKCINAGVQRLGCDIDDTSCSCREDNQSKLASDLEMVNCLTFGCHPNDLADIIAAGTKLCAGVTTSDPSASSSSSESTSSTGSKSSSTVVLSGSATEATGASGPHDAELNSGTAKLVAHGAFLVIASVIGVIGILM